MKVRCADRDGEIHWHDATPTALVVILDAIREGELLIMTAEGVTVDCYENAFTRERLQSTVIRYPSRKIEFDGVLWDAV